MYRFYLYSYLSARSLSLIKTRNTQNKGLKDKSQGSIVPSTYKGGLTSYIIALGPLLSYVSSGAYQDVTHPGDMHGPI